MSDIIDARDAEWTSWLDRHGYSRESVSRFLKRHPSPPVNLEKTMEERVIKEIRLRRIRGLSKYGTGAEESPLTTLQWIQHAKEEALDLAIYLERLQSDLSK